MKKFQFRENMKKCENTNGTMKITVRCEKNNKFTEFLWKVTFDRDIDLSRTGVK